MRSLSGTLGAEKGKKAMAQPRKPAGTPEGGQWAPSGHAEGDFVLAPEGVRPELVAEVTSHPHDANPDLILKATSKEVDWILEHGSSTHMATLSLRNDLTREQYLRLLDPEQPFSARLDVVGKCALGIPGLADKASYDPHPVIRAHAAYLGWDLSPERKRALLEDPEVLRVAEKMGLDLRQEKRD